jgi:hypothetical protein
MIVCFRVRWVAGDGLHGEWSLGGNPARDVP